MIYAGQFRHKGEQKRRRGERNWRKTIRITTHRGREKKKYKKKKIKKKKKWVENG